MLSKKNAELSIINLWHDPNLTMLDEVLEA
jgi:hypothetical protein